MRRSLFRLAAALLVLLAAAPFVARAADDFEVRAYVEPEGPLTDTRPLRLVIEVNGSRLYLWTVPAHSDTNANK